jgi:2-amino-4-hydroxy-6-hydroxymethyldihydropteridine diphosphokinase
MASDNELNDLDQAIIVALGSNLAGQYASSEALLEAALAAMNHVGLRVISRSSWWRSAAWPDPTRPAFLNGVALVETDLRSDETLAVLHKVEAAFGRDRLTINAPRTLDLDLIANGRTISTEPALPHPRAHERLFVMGPLTEIAPNWRHPISGETAAMLAHKAQVGLDAQPVFRQDQTVNEKPSTVEEEAFDWEGPPMDDAWLDAWEERNRVPLQKMLAEAEADIAAGRVLTMEEVEARLNREKALRLSRG